LKTALRAVFSSRGFGLAGLSILVIGTLLAFTARFFWVGELMANLRWQLGEGGLLATLFLLLAGLRRTAVAAFALSAFHLAPALLLEFGREKEVGTGPEITVATSNLWYANKEKALVRAWLEKDQPEVVAFFEVSDFWSHALPEFADLYPYQCIVASPDIDELSKKLRKELEDEDHEIVSPYEARWGAALLSRIPLEDVAVHTNPGSPDPFVQAVVTKAGVRIPIVALHPERPGAPPRNTRRDALLRHVATTTEWTDTTVVLADLNATVYSPIFSEFLALASLRDSRRGFGRQPTWNPPYGLPGEWLDLDHVLVRRGLVVLDLRTGPEIGSDHLPVIARLRVR
jgi:endonuclease/exonuclease/phosphatase (EEP) superfamily protein YafD